MSDLDEETAATYAAGMLKGEPCPRDYCGNAGPERKLRCPAPLYTEVGASGCQCCEACRAWCKEFGDARREGRDMRGPWPAHADPFRTEPELAAGHSPRVVPLLPWRRLYARGRVALYDGVAMSDVIDTGSSAVLPNPAQTGFGKLMGQLWDALSPPRPPPPPVKLTRSQRKAARKGEWKAELDHIANAARGTGVSDMRSDGIDVLTMRAQRRASYFAGGSRGVPPVVYLWCPVFQQRMRDMVTHGGIERYKAWCAQSPVYGRATWA